MKLLTQHLQEEFYDFCVIHNFTTLPMAIKDLLLFYISKKQAIGLSQIISENIQALIELSDLLDLAADEMTESNQKQK
jgi:hypothetical protein